MLRNLTYPGRWEERSQEPFFSPRPPEPGHCAFQSEGEEASGAFAFLRKRAGWLVSLWIQLPTGGNSSFLIPSLRRKQGAIRRWREAEIKI